MASQTHIHVIDGKQLTYPNNACPICGTGQQPQQQATSGASAYLKGNTVVLKFSRASLLTVTFWTQQKAILMTMSEIARDAQNNLMRDEKNNPIWRKTTRRISVPILKDFVYELSKLISNVENPSNVPKRD